MPLRLSLDNTRLSRDATRLSPAMTRGRVVSEVSVKGVGGGTVSFKGAMPEGDIESSTLCHEGMDVEANMANRTAKSSMTTDFVLILRAKVRISE